MGQSRKNRGQGARGAALAEYAILVGLISVFVIFAVLSLGRTVQDNFLTVASSLSSSIEVAEMETGPTGTLGGSGEPGVARFEPGMIGCIAEAGSLEAGSLDQAWCFDEGIAAAPEGITVEINDENYGEPEFWGEACAFDTIAAQWVQFQAPDSSIYLSCDTSAGGSDGGDTGGFPGNSG